MIIDCDEAGPRYLVRFTAEVYTSGSSWEVPSASIIV